MKIDPEHSDRIVCRVCGGVHGDMENGPGAGMYITVNVIALSEGGKRDICVSCVRSLYKTRIRIEIRRMFEKLEGWILK